MDSKFKKCGDMYVKFDDNNQPLYSFEIEYKNIKKFHLMCDEMPEEIVLPDLKKEAECKMDNEHILKFLEYIDKNPDDIKTEERYIGHYANGCYTIDRHCFEGIRKIKLVAPVDYSIKLSWCCFDKNTEVELVLPKDMTLKQIFYCSDTGFDYEHENWTLISHKDFDYSTKYFEGYKSVDHKDEYFQCKFKITEIDTEKRESDNSGIGL